jgi:hypothetical protein
MRRQYHHMNENDEAQNQPMEFMIIYVKGAGFLQTAWFHGETNLGSEGELESILNRLGNDGWDIVQIMPNVAGGAFPRIFLRRKAR